MCSVTGMHKDAHVSVVFLRSMLNLLPSSLSYNISNGGQANDCHGSVGRHTA